MVTEAQIFDLLDAAEVYLSDILPSDWAEKKRLMTSEVSPRPGKFSYEYTPYLREVVDCLSPSSPVKTVAVEKGAQIGFSTGVIENGIGWIIEESPGNILFLTGHADLSEEAVTGKIDNLIDNTGIRHLIRPNTKRVRNTRTGDTNKQKEFAGGSLIAGSAGNHKLLRQRSCRYGFIDDFDAAKESTEESGSTRKMIEQRFAAYNANRKLFYISTPELLRTSNIHPVYLMGDQRRYFIPCPCCGEYIKLDWEIPMEQDERDIAGMYWRTTDKGVLIPDSVGYRCYKCGDVFDDRNKTELLLRGDWAPTAEPVSPEYRSYHISALYAPVGMDDWTHYVRSYLEANPINKEPDEQLVKTFTNLVLGLPYEESGEAPKANQLQENTRDYDPGTVPESMSIKDGNGKIILLTLAVDLNGTVEDARADYEVVAWSETGATYSVEHGSIGTFIPKRKEETDRKLWTYEPNRSNSVWPEVDKLLQRRWIKDTGKGVRIHIAGVDAPSHFNKQASAYVDASNFTVFALKGKDTEMDVTRFNKDVKLFKQSANKPKLYLLEVNMIKDILAREMKLTRSVDPNEPQPVGFMNFPTPSRGLYTYGGFYSQFESEKRVIDLDRKGNGRGMRWVKKNSAVQNHFWDCRVYNIALRDMLVYMVGKELKKRDFTWQDYVDLVVN